MQIPILSGVYADTSPDFRTALPRNLVPVPKVTGISEGHLRVADGIVQYATASGQARGGILWNGTVYRVQGEMLVSVARDGTVTEIGNVGGNGPVSMDYGFDYLAIASGGNLWLYDGATLAQVTDSDLGQALDVIWVDGYFMTTDGTYIIVGSVSDPFDIDPLDYASAEIDPDRVVALRRVRGEVYVIGRYTIEVFSNVGGTGFPFQRVSGAQIHRGAVGARAVEEFHGGLAFIGSGRTRESMEPPAIWVGSNGGSAKLSTAEVDERLQGYTEETLATAVLEVVRDRGHETLMVHLPDVTLCYDAAASEALQQPVWYETDPVARYYIWQDRMTCANPAGGEIGYVDKTASGYWGEAFDWSFSTPIIYTEGRGLILHELELVCLTGSAAVGDDPSVAAQYSLDGVEWSQKAWKSAGKTGERLRRIRWMGAGRMGNYRIQKFTGRSDARLAMARVQAREEPLMW